MLTSDPLAAWKQKCGSMATLDGFRPLGHVRAPSSVSR
jgi:hypothetical protein